MIRSLRLQNFMAHEDTTIPLGPGLTALTGPNNVGKSAVVEALRCLATNPAPRHYIRHGAKEARVTLELADGHRVAWVRRKAGAGYELTRPGAGAPEEFWKLGRSGVPGEVQEVLRLALVELESGEPVDVHLGNQREPVFLLNQPPSTAAAFFAASTESAHLLAMQNLLKQRMVESKREAAKAAARLAGLDADLDRLAALPDLGLDLESAREQSGALETALARVPALELWLSRRAALDRRAKELHSRSQALAELPVPPLARDTARPSAALADLRRLAQAGESTRARSAALEPLAAPPEFSPTARVADLAMSLNILKSQMKNLSSKAVSLAGLQPSPTLHKTEALAGLLARFASLSVLQAEARKSLEACAGRLDTLRERIRIRLAEIGSCPTCGATLDFLHFVDREGA